MADTSKFGGGRGAQFGDRISPGPDAAHCAQCEAMLTDVLDGALGREDQALFESHLATCGPCADMLADAQRGAAWLEMLRDPRPEPPAELLERILAQTAGTQSAGAYVYGHSAAPVAANEAVFVAAPALSLRQRLSDRFRSAFSFHGLLQPRLAMTAAMAFFSIAVTMNLTGVRIFALHPADLKPSNIKQSFYSANARVVRYYEGLRVVYELESRVHDLETDSDTGSTPQSAAPAATPASPDQQQPSSSPDGRGTPEDSKPHTQAPGPGSSRRETPVPSARIVAVRDQSSSRHDHIPTRASERAGSAGNLWIDVRKVRALA